MMLNETMEIMPYMVFDTDVHKVDGTVTNSDSKIGVGSEFYWHFIRTRYFRLLTGATVELSYDFLSEPAVDKDNAFYIRAYLPLIAEVVMSDMISFRASIDVFTLQMRFRTWDFGAGEGSDTDFDFYTVNYIGDISFGLMFRFG